MRQFFQSHYQRIKSLYQRYERLLMPITLLVGFLLDYITFKAIQINTALVILFIYFIIAGLATIFIHLYDAERLSPRLRYIRLFAPLLIQFTFGALLGGTFIFYWFSGSIFVSWPFILILILLMVSNELFKHQFSKPLAQISIYYFITFSLLSIALPFFFNSLSPWLFLVAGTVGLLWIWGFVKLLSSFRAEIKERRLSFLALSFLVFAIMNIFYFFNLIPPVPLSVREAGVYHDIRRSGGSYVLQAERENFWQKIIPGRTIHLRPQDRAFAYTAIFAPTALHTTIFHDWQYYDPERKAWISKSKIPFAINGGRQEGYRGYSIKSNLEPGTWRVFVATQRGQVLGRIKFKVERVAAPPELEEMRR